MEFAAFALSLVAAVCREDSPESLPIRMQLSEPGPRFSIALDGRAVFTGGGLFGIGGPTYHDLYGDGLGAGLEVDALWRMSPKVQIGAYVQVDADGFDSGKEIDGLFGTTVEPRRTQTFRVVAGAKLREDFHGDSGFFAEQFAGFGAMVYSDLDGTLSSGGKVELLNGATLPTGELGGRFGYAFARESEVFFGIAFEISSGPRRGADLDVIAPGSSGGTEALLAFALQVGVRLRF